MDLQVDEVGLQILVGNGIMCIYGLKKTQVVYGVIYHCCRRNSLNLGNENVGIVIFVGLLLLK